MANRLKVLVSKNKRRYQEDGFDLDLTYIYPNIIAMGFPAENLEGVYRNHIDDVIRFLESKHREHYRIYNLCSERSYDSSRFQGHVQRYPFDDHHPPSIELIQAFCEDVYRWLAADRSNVAVIHCKAGKGRTGVMICCFIVHSHRISTAKETLDFYSKTRTNNHKGVTIPSQIRYVHYYSRIIHDHLKYNRRQLVLCAIKLEGIPTFSGGICYPYFIVYHPKLEHYRSDVFETVKKGDTCVLMKLAQPKVICGDVMIEFFNKHRMKAKEKMFHFWFNTFFVNEEEEADLESYVISNGSSPGSQNSKSLSVKQPVARRHSDQSTNRDPVLRIVQPPDSHLYLQKRVHDELLSRYSSSRRAGSFEINQSGQSKKGQTWPNKLSWGSSKPPDVPPAAATAIDESVPEIQITTATETSSKKYYVLVLRKNEIDRANKDKQHRLFPENFSVKVYFQQPEVVRESTSQRTESLSPTIDLSTEVFNAAAATAATAATSSPSAPSISLSDSLDKPSAVASSSESNRLSTVSDFAIGKQSEDEDLLSSIMNHISNQATDQTSQQEDILLSAFDCLTVDRARPEVKPVQQQSTHADPSNAPPSVVVVATNVRTDSDTASSGCENDESLSDTDEEWVVRV